MQAVKYVFVTGGVTSSLGKGIISASLAKLLQSRGYRVTIQKFDPYINIDPGTLNPYEHGECFVTDDGAARRHDWAPPRLFARVRVVYCGIGIVELFVEHPIADCVPYDSGSRRLDDPKHGDGVVGAGVPC